MRSLSTVASIALGLLSLSSTALAQNGPIGSTETFDYIVIGAGAAGLVAADKLSETGKKVLLIERGGPSTAETGGNLVPPWAPGTNLTKFDVPGLFESMFSGQNTFWFCKDVNVFAGCLIGGGTSVNAALYWLPPDRDWGTISGWPSGWSATDLAPAQARLKARLPGTDAPSPDGVRYLDQVYTLVSRILGGSSYQGITINSSPNSKNKFYGHSTFTFIGGKRGGPVATYFRTSKARSNFKYVQYTYVNSLVRNGAQITGVKTNQTTWGSSGVINLSSTGRVVLAAGAHGTARILIRSGIGPSDQLAIVQSSTGAADLPPASQFLNLPVGQNVLDNPSINLVFTHASIDSYDNWEPIWDNPRPADAAQYLKNGTGVFATASPRINFWREYTGSDGVVRYIQGTSRPGACCFTTEETYDATKVFTITIYLSHGIKSRGRLGIDVNLQAKTLNQPWLRDAVDKAVIIQAITDILTDVKKISGIQIVQPPTGVSPADFVAGYDPSTMNSNHWMGSTKLGTDSGLSGGTSVVDPNTKVYGTNNLFVVDAGIFPGMPMGNPQGAIMQAAEHAVSRIVALGGTPTTTSTAPQPTQTLWGQCGGNGWTGPKACPTGSKCTFQNDFYSQCTPN
ncbi:carbohydrate-binding module family 1 protein [Botryobasidium botryosum FD-172 SS1]|uniref:Carbohydrate-binding module family 1 protein n=1 Tax=Botryobasidium botryosum (strain FD-172 SS1) TaxID=930990 RepID=A0A067LWB7_BOTB1|nr:carbohydrate-binding module family 1 protein [Botryobasidium botryosum FD-172 SS1]